MASASPPAPSSAFVKPIPPPDEATTRIATSKQYPRMSAGDARNVFGYYHRFVLEASLRHIVLHGVNVDERICELLDTYTIDELFEGLAPRVTGAGVWLHSSLPKSRTPNGDFDLAIPSDLPKFELQSDLPGAYHAGYDTKNSSLDERGYIHIDSIYAGISSAKPAYAVQDISGGGRDLLQQYLLQQGFLSNEVLAHVRKVKAGGAVGRLLRNHCSAAHRRRTVQQTLHYVQTGAEHLPDWCTIGYVSGCERRDSSTFNKLEAGLLGIYEAFSILSSLSFFNPDWVYFSRTLANELKISNPFAVLHPLPLNRQVGLEGGWRTFDSRLAYLLEGGVVGLGAPNALGERSMNLTANMIFYDRAIRLPPAVQPHPELHVVRIQVSFAAQGITEWTDLQSRDPSAFCNSFAPLLPPPHLFIAILLTWLTPDELVKHIWLEGSQCPDPVSLHSYLITSLRPAWELLVFRQGVGLSVSTGDGGDGDDNVLDAIDEGSSAGGESVAGADGQAVEKSEGAAAGSTPDAATGAAGE